MAEGRNAAGFMALSVLFAVIIFIMIKAFLEDIMGEYYTVAIDASLSVVSLAQSWIFICTIAVFAAVFISTLISGIDNIKAIFSLSLSTLTTMLIITLISYVGLTMNYPFQFAQIGFLEILSGFNFYNMLFAVYVLRSTDAYYFIVFALLFGQTLIYLTMTKAFKKEVVSTKTRGYRIGTEVRL